MSSSSPHSELIESLDEFYTLLFELGAMTRDYLRRPDPATGRHPGDALNADAARAAGYSEDAVCLLYQLPYIGTSFSEYQIDILYDSVPVDYLAVKDEVQFEDLREMYDDEMLPSSTVRLTRTCVYGTNLVYDVDARLLVPWKPFDEAQDTYDLRHGKPAREVLGPIIDKWRSLEWLAWADNVD
ncbi:hypothetical protein UCRPC4_g05458 [Phaeomoniella chlamydospora]|uniref:Uncharacterized protein n=1 Tax=Phaeomoniella chlamydospora TaxID=158046 RepID=A0A0G2E3B3_PHACM|nr:hypothetical protein UCRPC4_g05458 [Phaeomoniella chlamydospora]